MCVCTSNCVSIKIPLKVNRAPDVLGAAIKTVSPRVCALTESSGYAYLLVSKVCTHVHVEVCDNRPPSEVGLTDKGLIAAGLPQPSSSEEVLTQKRDNPFHLTAGNLV